MSNVTVKTDRTRVVPGYLATHAIPGNEEFRVEPCRPDRLVGPAAGPIARPVSGPATPGTAPENLPDDTPDHGIDYRPDPWHHGFVVWVEYGANSPEPFRNHHYGAEFIAEHPGRAYYRLTSPHYPGWHESVEVRREIPARHLFVDWREIKTPYHGRIVYTFLKSKPRGIE